MYDFIKKLLTGSHQVAFLEPEASDGSGIKFSAGDQRAKWDRELGRGVEQSEKSLKVVSLTGKELSADWPKIMPPDEEQKRYDVLYDPEDDRREAPKNPHIERLSYSLTNGSKEFRMLAVQHMGGMDAKPQAQFAAMEEHFDELRPQIVFYEGPTSEPVSMTLNQAYEGDQQFTQYLVMEHNKNLQPGEQPIIMESWDMPLKDAVEEFKKKGYSSEEIAANEVFKWMYGKAESIKHDGSLTEQQRNEKLHELQSQYESNPVDPNIDPEFFKWIPRDDGQDWTPALVQEAFQKVTGRSVDHNLKHADSLRLQKMFADLNIFRDVYAVKKYAEALKKYDRVMTVAGSAHSIRERDAMITFVDSEEQPNGSFGDATNDNLQQVSELTTSTGDPRPQLEALAVGIMPTGEKNRAEMRLNQATDHITRYGDTRLDHELATWIKPGEAPRAKVWPTFSNGDSKVTLVGVSHTKDMQSPMMRDIVSTTEEYIAATPLERRLVMVEGLRGGIPTWKSEEDANTEAGEMGVIAFRAQQAGVDVISPEAPQEGIINKLKAEGVPADKIASFYILRQLPGLLKRDTPDAEKIADFAGAIYEYSQAADTGWIQPLGEDEIQRVASDPVFKQELSQRIIQAALPRLNASLRDTFMQWNTTLDTDTRAKIDAKNLSEKEVEQRVFLDLIAASESAVQDESSQVITYDKNGIGTNADIDTLIYLTKPGNEAPAIDLRAISRVDNEARDEYLLQSIDDAVKAGKNPLVEFGGTHAIKIAPALIYRYPQPQAA
ncbi:MAG: hypothetical protein H0W89_01800 [Candidatus Levybacteria bacterium]|nr:hypothetical protein [Candidatus Levybacteria bacterium]